MQNLVAIFRHNAKLGSATMTANLKALLQKTLLRDLLLDLQDTSSAMALKAFEMIRDHSGLDEKRSRELVGQARFRMTEKGFVDVCLKHGGQLLPEGAIPGKSARSFQPFMRFGEAGAGVVLGLASMPGPRELPTKNQSRAAGVMLNEFLSPRLDLGDAAPKPGDVFGLFLVARDRARLGMIEEVAIGTIDHNYLAYLFYEPLDRFLAGYASASGPAPKDGGGSPNEPLVRLKPRRGVFQPPEAGKKKPKRDGTENK
jgi:hypothetical protein